MLLEREAAAFAEENKLSLVTVTPALTVGPTLSCDLNLSLMLSLSLLSGNYQLTDFVHYMQLISKMNDTISAGGMHRQRRSDQRIPDDAVGVGLHLNRARGGHVPGTHLRGRDGVGCRSLHLLRRQHQPAGAREVPLRTIPAVPGSYRVRPSSIICSI